MTLVADRVQSSYLGYALTITDAGVTAFHPDGGRICRTTSLSRARSCIRAYRRTERNEPAASLREKATAGSERTEATP